MKNEAQPQEVYVDLPDASVRSREILHAPSHDEQPAYIGINKAYKLIIIGSAYELESFEKRILIKKFKKIKEISELPNQVNSVSRVTDYLRHIVGCHSPKIIVINLPENTSHEIIKGVDKAAFDGITFLTAHTFIEKYLYKCVVTYEEGFPATLPYIKPFTIYQKIIKRFTDLVIAVVLLISSLPLWIYSALRIQQESPGPVFYRQKRVCRNNREFTCIKFRSMVVNAEPNGAQWAIRNDPRVFAYGELMRMARLDELPQLINVLQGHLSMIGPRPERNVFIEVIEQQIDCYRHRHLVKPGITGWAQVNYPYGASLEDARQKMMYDLYYMKHWSIWLDLKIVYLTVITVLLRKGL